MPRRYKTFANVASIYTAEMGKKNSLFLISIFGRVIHDVAKKVEREVKIDKKRISADISQAFASAMFS